MYQTIKKNEEILIEKCVEKNKLFTINEVDDDIPKLFCKPNFFSSEQFLDLHENEKKKMVDKLFKLSMYCFEKIQDYQKTNIEKDIKFDLLNIHFFYALKRSKDENIILNLKIDKLKSQIQARRSLKLFFILKCACLILFCLSISLLPYLLIYY